MSALVEARDLHFSHRGREKPHPIFQGLSFTVEEGKILSVVGPSGCGKSTLLSLLLGLLRPSQGELLFEGAPLGEPSRKRMIVFQNHALFPWLTCLGNVVFALESSAAPPADLRAEGLRLLERVGLEKSAGLYPGELSGGMQQRAGIARALAAKPRLLLLDEPFSSLDQIRRHQLLGELAELVRASKTTVVFVTHDVKEALRFGDQALVLGGAPFMLTQPDETQEKEIYAHWNLS